MPDPFDGNVNVVPFAARQAWTSPNDYEIWWEDPRDIYQVSVTLDSPISSGTPAPVMAYWRNSWPGVRVAKGAVVGAGESGWLANDDWTNGKWQPADCEVKQEGPAWIFTFRPLNALEFPEEISFPVVFRRTLKLRLTFSGTQEVVKLNQVAAVTDSVWREADIAIEWKSITGKPAHFDGYLEAFNGEIHETKAITNRTTLTSRGQWHSAVDGETASGVLSAVRYAFNDDRNSFDRTIVTLRSDIFGNGLTGVSFFLDDVLDNAAVYVRDLGLLVRKAGQKQDFHSFERAWEQSHTPTLYDQIQDLPEQTWERSWANMTRKTSGMYFTLGCEGSRQKFGMEPNGDLFMTDTYIHKVPGKDTGRLDWKRELRLKFGFPPAGPRDRSILEGYLPVIRTVWVENGVVWEQEAFATWLWGEDMAQRKPGDDPVIAMLQVRFTNLEESPRQIAFPMRSVTGKEKTEAIEFHDGRITNTEGKLRLLFETGGQGSVEATSAEEVTYALELGPRAFHSVTIKIPHVDLSAADELTQLASLDYSTRCEQVTAFWRQRIAQGASIQTPNETINHFYKTHLMHMLVINDREPGADRNVARCGGFYYGSFPDEGCMGIVDLDRRGLHEDAERCLDLYVHYQGSVPLPGNFQSAEGVFYGSGGYEEAGYNRNQGWVLWCLAEHYRFTRDRAWLERIAPALVKGCDWIIRERQVTLNAGGIQKGFLPSGSLEDVTDYWTWLATNACAAWGFKAAAGVLAEINHPESGRLVRESHAFSSDLRKGFFESCARSPVVCLRDGTWVPHFPARQERRGRDFGWLREVLEGACHLIFCGLISPDEPAAGWIIKDFEDNLFLSEQYGYQAKDFERQWFDLGGFSMQSNLLLFPELYLWRDEPRHYLRGYFNGFTSAFFPDTVTMCEHALPDLDDWRGDHFKSSDEANSNGWLRKAFLAEMGNDLFVGQAIPRAWFEHGKTMRVERAATHFGETSVEFASLAATGEITVRLDPPLRNPPEHILLRVRHPESKQMKAVWIDGMPYSDFNPPKEVINLGGLRKPINVKVVY
jgi:hypothetical protein